VDFVHWSFDFFMSSTNFLKCPLSFERRIFGASYSST